MKSIVNYLPKINYTRQPASKEDRDIIKANGWTDQHSNYIPAKPPYIKPPLDIKEPK